MLIYFKRCSRIKSEEESLKLDKYFIPTYGKDIVESSWKKDLGKNKKKIKTIESGNFFDFIDAFFGFFIFFPEGIGYIFTFLFLICYFVYNFVFGS